MTGGFQERILGPKKKKTNIDNLNLDENRVFGKRLDMQNILGKHFRVLPRGVEHYNIILDVTLHDVSKQFSSEIYKTINCLKRPVTSRLNIARECCFYKRTVKTNIC